MNILVIKQTSLGDALHASGPIRAIKENFPASRITLLTAASSADIYRHNPWVSDLIILDLAAVKRDWRRKPGAAWRHIAAVLRAVRARRFDLAFDLQGLARSVVFLYAARAGAKFVKGRWWGLARYRRPELHAIAEMQGVLRCAGLSAADTTMEFFTDAESRRAVDDILARINPRGLPLAVFSPLSRWRSKDWPLARYVELAARLCDGDGGARIIVFTGAESARARIDDALAAAAVKSPATPSPATVVNLAGQLTLVQFAEVVARARVVVSGDSFPMHLACAQKTPAVALFGPTDEAKTGPIGAGHTVIRAPNCAKCDNPDCARRCLDNISVDTVFNALAATLDG